MDNKEEKKKGLLDRMIDAVSSRDEKAAMEEAKKQAEEANKELEEKAKEAESVKAELEKAEAELNAIKEEKRREEARARVDSMRQRQQELAKAHMQPKILKEHTLTDTETLSHLSLKYYGSAVRDFWMVIYEANKDVIGDNPAHVVPGMVLKIPVLPAKFLKDED